MPFKNHRQRGSIVRRAAANARSAANSKSANESGPMSMSHLKNTAVILAAHGSSKDVRINQAMFGLAERVAMSGRFGAVTPAFLDGQPSVQWVLEEIKQEHVVVIPFMTSCGYYANGVFPKHLKARGKQIQFVPPIGVHPGQSNDYGRWRSGSVRSSK